MNRKSGNALLLVTLLSVVMVLSAMALVSFTSTQSQTSYALNNQVRLRYAAEGVIEEVKLRLVRDQNEAPVGEWFSPTFRAGLSSTDRALYDANPNSGPYTAARPGVQSVLGSPQIRVDVYFDKTAGVDEYIARAVAYLKSESPKKNSAVLRQTFTYKITREPPRGEASFSKYALFLDRWDPDLWFGHEHYDGLVHSNGDAQFMFKDARFRKRLTYVGTTRFYNDPSWTTSQKDALFPAGKRRVARIDMPDFQNIRSEIRPIARSGPPELFLDPTVPGPWQNVAMDTVKVTFVWDPSEKQNYAFLQSFQGSSVTQTLKFAIPKDGGDTLIYSTRKVHVKGIIQGRVTLVSESASTVTSDPSVKITDDIIYVDDQGRPKTWVYTSGGAALPASGRRIFTDPITGEAYRYAFSGIPTAGNPVANTINTETYLGRTVEWNQRDFIFKQNPDYEHANVDPVLGMISRGKFGIGAQVPYNTIQNWTMYTPNSNYEVEQQGERGNLAKYGSVIARDTPWDGTYYGPGIWTGYGRQLPHIYDQHLLNNPPPYFVKVPDMGEGGIDRVRVEFGAAYFGAHR